MNSRQLQNISGTWIYKIKVRVRDSRTCNYQAYTLLKCICSNYWTFTGLCARPNCSSLVRIFQKMCNCCYIFALSFFTGFKMCHKILLGQGTRQATRWLRMIYFSGFRLVKKKHRKKVSTYLWTCRIWEIKGPWSPSSTDSLVISKPLLQCPVSWPSDLDFNIFSNETQSYKISVSWLDRCWWARSSFHWGTMSFL